MMIYELLPLSPDNTDRSYGSPDHERTKYAEGS